MSMHTYRVYGIAISSSFAFRYHLQRCSEAPQLQFIYHGVSRRRRFSGTELTPTTPSVDSHGDLIRLFVDNGRETIVFPGVAAFECSAREIHAWSYAPDLEFVVEIALIGTVMCYWLERRGISALHASAVVLDGRAAAFIGGSSCGKTTTMCAFAAAGDAVLTDDMLAITVAHGAAIAHPGYPQMKLLPEHLALLGAGPEGYERIHPRFDKLRVPIGSGVARYQDSTVPLGAIYLLDRVAQDEDPSTEPIGEAPALMELIRHSFVARLLDMVDRGQDRLSRLAAITRATKVKRLHVPFGYRRLPEVRTTVIDDMRASVANGDDGGRV